MDEPTAALSAAEAERLFSIIRDLRRSGVAVLYVSHRLDEILELCRHVTVFRDGRSVAELAGRGPDAAGDGGGDRRRRRRCAGEADERSSLRASLPCRVRDLARAPKVKGVSFDLRKGEVLGLGGLVGAGRTELARLLFGVDRPQEGSMTLEGKPYAPRSPADAVKSGVGFVPEERRVEGLILSKSLAFNVSLANLQSIIFHRALPFISGSRRKALAERAIRDLAIKTTSAETAVGRLSGGNQQKVVIARWLASRPKVLILDEPTRGVDVGARAEIHRLIRNLATRGHGGACHILRAGGTAGHVRPGAYHGGRQDRRRVGRRGADPSADHRGELRQRPRNGRKHERLLDQRAAPVALRQGRSLNFRPIRDDPRARSDDRGLFDPVARRRFRPSTISSMC